MPDESPDPPRRKRKHHVTWKDWLPEGTPEPPAEELLTRDEVLAKVRSWRSAQGDVDESTLRFWEANDVLPHAVRRRHLGATRAVYPIWYAYLVGEVMRLRHKGFGLQQIKPRARNYVRYDLGYGTSPIDDEVRQFGRVEGPEDLGLTPGLLTELEHLAAMYERVTGVPVADVVVHVRDTQAGGAYYPLPINLPEESNSESDSL